MNKKSRRANRGAVAGHGKDLMENYGTHRVVAPVLQEVSRSAMIPSGRPQSGQSVAMASAPQDGATRKFF